jgi:hypothetical protein
LVVRPNKVYRGFINTGNWPIEMLASQTFSMISNISSISCETIPVKECFKAHACFKLRLDPDPSIITTIDSNPYHTIFVPQKGKSFLAVQKLKISRFHELFSFVLKITKYTTLAVLRKAKFREMAVVFAK